VGNDAVDVAALAELVDAVAGRLRSLGEGRLGRPPMRVGLGLPEPARTDGPSVADRGFAVASELVVAAAQLEDVQPPPLPRLGDLVVGDQVAVTGHDLVAALRRCPSDDPSAAEALQTAHSALKALHHEL